MSYGSLVPVRERGALRDQDDGSESIQYDEHSEAENSLTAERDEDSEEEDRGADSYPDGYTTPPDRDDGGSDGVWYEEDRGEDQYPKEFDDNAAPSDQDDGDYGPNGARYDENSEEEDSDHDEVEECATSDEDDQDFDPDDPQYDGGDQDFDPDDPQYEGGDQDYEPDDVPYDGGSQDFEPDDNQYEGDQDYDPDDAPYHVDNEDSQWENSNNDTFDGYTTPLDRDGQEGDGALYDEDPGEEFDGHATQLDDDEPEYLRVMQERETDAWPTSLQYKDADWEPRCDATQDRCQSTHDVHTQFTSHPGLMTEHDETSGRHVDAQTCYKRRLVQHADTVRRVPPEPPPSSHSILGPLDVDASFPRREAHPHYEGDLEGGPCGRPDGQAWPVNELVAPWDDNQEPVRVSWNLDSTNREVLQADDRRDKLRALEAGACVGFALLQRTLVSLRQLPDQVELTTHPNVVTVDAYHLRRLLSCPTYGPTLATVSPQSVNPDRPTTFFHHADMWIITHDAHQCNMCDPGLTPLAHALTSIGAILIEAEQQSEAIFLGHLAAECASSCQALRATHAAMDHLRRSYSALGYQPGHANYNIEHLHNEVARCEHENILHPRKVAHRHGSPPSPSCALSRLASFMQEDPVAELFQPTHPLPLRAATTSRPYVPPVDTPSVSSLSLGASGGAGIALAPPTLAAFAPTQVAVPGAMPVDTSGESLVSPNPAAFAPAPFMRPEGSPSFLPALGQRPVPFLAAVSSMHPNASGILDFAADARCSAAIRILSEGRPPWSTALVHRASLLTQRTPITRVTCTFSQLHGVVLWGGTSP
jgi:hypothetical protein